MADDTSTETTEENAAPAEEKPETDQLGDTGKKALEAERTRAKDAERRAKAAERALEAEKAKGLSESERAIAAAKAEGAQEAALAAGKRLARAEIKAAAASAGLDASDLLDDLDLSRFVGDDGEPDEAAIAARVKRWAAITPAKGPRGNADQGHRGKPAADTPAAAFARLLQGQ